MSYSSSITNLSSSCVSFIKSGFVFLLGFTPSLSLSNLGVSLIKSGFFFLLGFTTVNKAAKAFIQNQYNDWFSDQVARQLKSGKDPTDIKVSSKLSDLKPLHASWIVDLYKHMQGEDELILKGFKEAVIYEAINDAQEVFERVENPFRA